MELRNNGESPHSNDSYASRHPKCPTTAIGIKFLATKPLTLADLEPAKALGLTGPPICGLPVPEKLPTGGIPKKGKPRATKGSLRGNGPLKKPKENPSGGPPSGERSPSKGAPGARGLLPKGKSPHSPGGAQRLRGSPPGWGGPQHYSGANAIFRGSKNPGPNRGGDISPEEGPPP